MLFKNEVERVEYLHYTNQITDENRQEWLETIRNDASSRNNAELYVLACDTLGCQPADKDLYRQIKPIPEDSRSQPTPRENPTNLENRIINLEKNSNPVHTKEQALCFLDAVDISKIDIENYEKDSEAKKDLLVSELGDQRQALDTLSNESVGFKFECYYNHFKIIYKD